MLLKKISSFYRQPILNFSRFLSIKNRVIYYFLGFIIGLLVLFLVLIPFSVKNYFDKNLYKIEIPNGSSGSKIVEILYSNGIIRDEISFKIYLYLFSYGNKFKSGIYYLSPSMTNAKIAYLLSEGKTTMTNIKVTIPEGASIYKMARIIADAGIEINRENFERLAIDGINSEVESKFPFLKSVPIKSLEGYLFPDTYFFQKSSSIDQIVSAMLNRFSEVVLPIYSKSNSKFSLHQVLTLASIIEKEAQIDEERPIIASVFLNRLKNNIALRADPTIKYALKNPSKRVMFSHLQVNSPYNTYLYRGLPPGPICSPGIKSIEAVLNPAKTNYLYFVSNGDGTHTFSSSWNEHKKAADRFRKK